MLRKIRRQLWKSPMEDRTMRVCRDTWDPSDSPSSGNSQLYEPYLTLKTEGENARHPFSQLPLQLWSSLQTPPSRTLTQEPGPIKNPLCQGCHRSEIYSHHPAATIPSFCGVSDGIVSRGNNDVISGTILMIESQQVGPDSAGLLKNLWAPQVL